MVKLKPRTGQMTAQRVVVGSHVFEANMTIEERFIPLINGHFDLETLIESPEKKTRRTQEVHNVENN